MVIKLYQPIFSHQKLGNKLAVRVTATSWRRKIEITRVCDFDRKGLQLWSSKSKFVETIRKRDVFIWWERQPGQRHLSSSRVSRRKPKDRRIFLCVGFQFCIRVQQAHGVTQKQLIRNTKPGDQGPRADLRGWKHGESATGDRPTRVWDVCVGRDEEAWGAAKKSNSC
jgi:hypothetical protein